MWWWWFVGDDEDNKADGGLEDSEKGVLDEE
jgi:hypothetical protein